MLEQQQNDVPRYLRLLLRLHEIVPAWVLGSLFCMLFIAIVQVTAGADLKLAVKRAWSRWDVHRAAELLQDEVTAQEGVRILRDALVRAPDEPEVIRSLARLTAGAGMLQHARFFFRHLERQGAMTDEDALQHAAVIARLNDHSGAQIMLRAFAEQNGGSPALWRVQAEAASIRGDHHAAHMALGKVLADVPEDEQAALGMARAEALSTEARCQHAGIERLIDLFEESRHDYDATRRNTCLWTLSSLSITDAAQRARFARLIGEVSWQRLERLVLQRLLEWSVDPADPRRLRLRADLALLLSQNDDAGLGDRLGVARLLQRHGEHALVLDWVRFPVSLKDAALCATRLDSLLAMKQWLAASNLIEHEDSPLPQVLQSIFRAQVELLRAGGSSSRGEQLLTRAFGHACAADHQPALIALGRLAAEFGRHRIAFEAYARAMRPQHPLAQFMSDALVREARLGGATAAEVLQALEQRDAVEFWNQEWQRRLAYYRLLCGDKLELVEARARTWKPEHDPEAALLSTLSSFRLGRTADLAVLPEFIRRNASPELLFREEESLLTACVRPATPPPPFPRRETAE